MRKICYAGDYELLACLAYKTEIANLPDVLAQYRQNPQQLSSKFKRVQDMEVLLIRQSLVYQTLGEILPLDVVSHLRSEYEGKTITDQFERSRTASLG